MLFDLTRQNRRNRLFSLCWWFPYSLAGYGMKWNGMEILLCNMEDARMEWNRFQEWNGRQSSILPY